MDTFTISPTDQCPACKKKLVNLNKEWGGILKDTNSGGVICKCGCIYVPWSHLQPLVQKIKSPIIQPADSPEGRLIKL